MPSPATVSANLNDLTGQNLAGGKVTFTLANYGDNIPRVIGVTNISTNPMTFTADGSGNVSTTLWGNDNIDPSGTFYYFQVADQYNKPINTYAFRITGSSANLNTQAPITVAPVVTPPTGDSTYLRLDGGNKMTGDVLANAVGQHLGSPGTPWDAYLRNTFFSARPWADVVSFGAIADNQTVPANTSIGTNIVTLTQPLAVPSDVGKVIVLNGGGPAGAYIFSTITSYLGSTQVTMAATASSSTAVTMWWGTDNTTAFNNAIAVGTSIFVPAGNYGIVGPITLTNTHLTNFTGQGSGVTFLTHLGSTDLLKVNTGTITDFLSEIISDFTIQCNGCPNENGVHQINATGVTYDQLAIRDAIGAGSALMLMDNQGSAFSERTSWRKISFFNGKIGLRFIGTNSSSKSYLYSRMTECHFQLGANQVGISVESGSLVQNGYYSFFYNGAGAGSEKMLEVTGASQFTNNMVDAIGESTNTTLHIDSTSGASIVGLFQTSTGLVTVDAGGVLSYTGSNDGFGNNHFGISTQSGSYLLPGASGLTSVTLTSGQNDNVPILTSASVKVSGPGAAYSVTGFTGGQDGRVLIFWNPANVAFTIKNQTGSTAANQIITKTGADITLPTQTNGNVVTFIYDAGSSRWILISTT